MIYIIRKNTNYKDIKHERVDVGLYYVEEKHICNPKEYTLFGTECCKEFIKENVFFDDQEGAYIECLKRNKKVIDSFLKHLHED